MPNKVVYISEQQERDLIRKIMSESVVVNSNQVSEIVNLLNSCFQPTINHTGDVGTNRNCFYRNMATYRISNI